MPKLETLLQSDLSDPFVQQMIGWHYYRGTETLQNFQEAVKWFRKAAAQGDAGGLAMLGNCCFDGLGTPRDPGEAYRCYQRADFTPRPKRRKGHFDENGKLLETQDFSAFPGLPEAARRGDPAAMTMMGNCCFLGRCITPNCVLAVAWYQKAAAAGDPEAMWALGYAYITGAGVERNCQEGVRWFLESAKSEFVPALHNLSLCYAQGVGVEKDPELAREYARRSETLKAYGNFSCRYFTPRDYYISCRTYQLTDILTQQATKEH